MFIWCVNPQKYLHGVVNIDKQSEKKEALVRKWKRKGWNETRFSHIMRQNWSSSRLFLGNHDLLTHSHLLLCASPAWLTIGSNLFCSRIQNFTKFYALNDFMIFSNWILVWTYYIKIQENILVAWKKTIEKRLHKKFGHIVRLFGTLVNMMSQPLMLI